MKSENLRTYVENYFNTDISNRSREGDMPFKRQVFFALSEKFCKPEESGTKIARKLGFDHATRLHAIKRFDQYYNQAFYKKFSEAYDELSKFITANDLNHSGKQLKTIREIENDYRLKFIRIVEKQHGVITSIKRKSEIYNRSEVFQEVLGLPEPHLKEFEQMAKVFLKRKKKELNYHDSK